MHYKIAYIANNKQYIKKEIMTLIYTILKVALLN